MWYKCYQNWHHTINMRATTELLLLFFRREEGGGIPPFIVCVSGRPSIGWSSSELDRTMLKQVTRK